MDFKPVQVDQRQPISGMGLRFKIEKKMAEVKIFMKCPSAMKTRRDRDHLCDRRSFPRGEFVRRGFGDDIRESFVDRLRR